MKNKMTNPIAILIGLCLIACAIYLGLTIEFRSVEKGCKKEYQNYKDNEYYEMILSDCINDKLE
jgi:hypothetical protein